MTDAAGLANQTDFDAIAEVYDGVFAPHIREHYLHRRADMLLRYAPGPRVLDVGAGTGILAERLIHRGLEVVALDPFPQMLEQLRRRLPAAETVVAHGHAIPYPDNAFDLTYSVAVLHHVAEPERVRQTLGEMVRVTRPGGRILIWDHNPLNPYWPILMRRVPQDSGAERLVPLEEILSGLTARGAAILRAERCGLVPEFTPEPVMPIARAIERVVEMTPGVKRYCAHNVVVAQKP